MQSSCKPADKGRLQKPKVMDRDRIGSCVVMRHTHTSVEWWFTVPKPVQARSWEDGNGSPYWRCPSSLLQLVMLHTALALSLELTQLKGLVSWRVSVVPQTQQLARQLSRFWPSPWDLESRHLPEQAWGKVASLLPGSKNCCNGMGGGTYQGFFSSRRSGTTFTKAIYRNPPEVKGRIHATVSPIQIQKAFVITVTKPRQRTEKGKKIRTWGQQPPPSYY